MANKEIKQTIRLDGEKEYNAAIREAQRNLRTLRSELKAETAELGANATAQQKNEARSKSLQKQIKEQEEIVKTLRKALEEAKKDYGDNEDVVAKWETKLNEARATLGNMKNELDGLGQAYESVNESTEMGIVATKSFADSVASIASVGDSVSSAIEDIFTGLIDRISDVVVDLWDLIGETAAKANSWADIAGYWNTDTANVEKWARAVKASGNSFEDFENIVSRINLGGKGKQITEMLGISDANYEDQWSYAIAVMDRIAELQGKGTLPDDFWETVFGEKKATKAKDIVNDWATVQEGLERYDADKGGLGMGSEALETMSKLHEQISTVEQDWQAIKDKVASGFGTITGDLLFNVSGGLEAINDILNAETEAEREEAIKKLEQNVSELFQKVADAIRAGIEILGDVGEELSNSDDPVVAAIGKIMKDIADALEWMVKNQGRVKMALEAIFGAWLVGRLTSIAGKLTAIVAQINLIKAFNAGGGAAAGAGAAASGAASSKAGGIASVVTGAGGGSVLAGIGALIAAGIAGAKMIEANLKDNKLNAVYGNDSGEGGVLEAMSPESWAKAAEYFRIYNDETMTGTDKAFDARDSLFESLERDGVDLSEQAVSLLENTFDNYLNGSDVDGLVSAIEQHYPGFFSMTPGTIVDDTLDSDVKSMESTVGVKLDDIKDAVVRSARENARAYAGMTVTLDGAVVGRLITPYVSGGIARNVMVDR